MLSSPMTRPQAEVTFELHLAFFLSSLTLSFINGSGVGGLGLWLMALQLYFLVIKLYRSSIRSQALGTFVPFSLPCVQPSSEPFIPVLSLGEIEIEETVLILVYNIDIATLPFSHASNSNEAP